MSTKRANGSCPMSGLIHLKFILGDKIPKTALMNCTPRIHTACEYNEKLLTLHV